MIDPETATTGLAMLNVAAAELIEDIHADLLDASDTTILAYSRRAAALAQLAADLTSLAAAAHVLVERCRHD